MNQDPTNLIGYNRDSDEEKLTRVILPRPVVAYRRTSKPKEKDKASFEEQQNVLDECEKSGAVNILDSDYDAHSACGEHERCERRGLKRVVKLALDLKVPVLVPRADRFTRTYATYQRFVAKGGVLLVASLGLDAPAEMIDLATRNAEEDAERLHRVCAIGIKNMKSGKKAGNPKLSQARDKSIESRQATAYEGYVKFDRHLQAIVAAGAKTCEEKAIALNRLRFRTPKGGKWSAGNVKNKEDIIAELRASGGFPNATETPAVNDDIAPIGRVLSLHCGASTDTRSIGARACEDGVAHPLSTEELAELREFAGSEYLDQGRLETFMKKASDPDLLPEKRALILTWIAQKRAKAA